MKPRRERKIIGCKLQLSRIKKDRTECEAKSVLEAMDNLQKQKETLEHMIQENNSKAERLNKRIFFKRWSEKKVAELKYESAKNEEKIIELNQEYKKLQIQLQEKHNLQKVLEDRIQQLSKNYSL
jgi:predicted  nucleic acid-binding Zn-ribbon protein